MISIYNCFNCDKKITHENNKYFFWCDKTCHDNYHKNLKKKFRQHEQWSKFMCDEGPCPKGMEHLAPKENKEFPKKKVEDSTNKRTCSKCGKPGHNARGCGKHSKKKGRKATKAKRKIKEKVSTRRATKVKNNRNGKRKIKCGKCQKFGHNARTCKS